VRLRRAALYAKKRGSVTATDDLTKTATAEALDPRSERILVLDFGSQYAQLIARRVREHHVYCEIVRHDLPAARIRQLNPVGLILSGGPASVYTEGSPHCDPELFRLGVPVLGICYGMQLSCYLMGADVHPGEAHEYGRTALEVVEDDPLFHGLPRRFHVWMSHGDQVVALPPDWVPLARTEHCPVAAVRHRSLPIWGLQFHPEVRHTQHGTSILHNFLYRICGCRGLWHPSSFVTDTVTAIRERVGQSRVICGLSGGVDSAVTAALVHKAIGDQLVAVFIDNGLLRKGERETVERTFRDNFHIELRVVDARERFLSALRGVTDPQEKRRIIGHVFVDVFTAEAKKIPGARFLAQGTLYPDVIESGGAPDAPSATIKTHHNVGGLPPDMELELIEPLRDLFKDEVRKIGELLKLPDEIVWRHPFPGPGLAVRCLGEVTEEKLAALREADDIFIREIRKAGLYRSISQAFAVLLPVQSVGVMGDYRTYANVIALRAVTTDDFMTADWVHLPYELLDHVAHEIIRRVRGVNRVVYDISTKPPATIEWE